MKRTVKTGWLAMTLLFCWTSFSQTVTAATAVRTPSTSEDDSYEDYVGGWEYDTYTNYIRIDEDYTWVSLDSLGNILGSGTVEEDRHSITLLDRSDKDVLVLKLQEEKLEDQDGDTLSMADIPDQIGQPLEDYIGIWADEDATTFVDFHENNRLSYYVIEEGELLYITDVTYSYVNGGIEANASNTIQQGYSVGEASFMLNSSGKLRDHIGTVFTHSELPEHTLPMPSDELSENISLATAEDVAFHYPARMKPYAETDMQAFLYTPGWSEGTPDKFSQIEVLVVPVDEIYDEYMNAGQAIALRGMNKMAGSIMYNLFGDYMLAGSLTNFENGGSYYQIVGVTLLDPSIYEEDAGTDIVGGIIIRYTGPTGYAQVISAMAPEESFTRYMQIACNMMDAMDTDTEWSTAAEKEVPLQPALEEEPAASSSNSQQQPAAPTAKMNVVTGKGVSAKSGYDLPRPFYWTDSDGDIWYWNGTSNVFYGWGDDYYIEDGMVMESNDSGWADEFDDWSDPGDYYDDYYDYDEYEYDDYYDYDEYEYDDYDYEYDDYEYEYDDYDYDYYDDYNYDYDYSYDYDSYSYDYDYDSGWDYYVDYDYEDW